MWWRQQVAEDIGHGLLAVHKRGIVHRDLKPHNVLLIAHHRAKLSDMGHSKRLLDQQASFESPGAGDIALSMHNQGQKHNPAWEVVAVSIIVAASNTVSS